MHWTKQKVQPQSPTSTFSQKADCSADPAERINDSKRHERIWKLFLIAQFRAYYQLISTKAVGVENIKVRYWYLFKNKNYKTFNFFYYFFVCVSNPHSPQHWSGLRPHLHSAMAPVPCCLYLKALLSTPLSTHAALRDLQLADSSSCLQRAVPLGHYHTGTRLQVMSGALVTGWYAALSQETFAQRTAERNVQPERDSGLRTAEHLWPAAQGPLVLLHTNFQWWAALITLCGDHHQRPPRQLTFQWRLMV